jgi:hypothetical protein
MIIETRKGFLTDVQVLFDDERALERFRSGRFDRLMIMSYNQLPLSGFSVVTKKTGIIELDVPIEEVLKSFNDTAQKKISRTMRYEGFRFVSSEYPFPPEAYDLYCAFERAQRRTPFPSKAFSSCIAFLGYDGDQLVSGAFVYPTSPIVRARSFFSRRGDANDHEAYKRISYASNRVFFEVCKWGKETGRTGYDLGSINMTDDKKAGISNFKLSFNPRIAPEYTYVRSKPLYKLLEHVQGLKRRFL